MNIALLLDLIADTFGDRTAVTDGSGDLSYDRLRTLARTAATRLIDAGAHTLAFADVNSAAVPVALFGAAWAGAAYAPLNFRLPPASLAAQVDRLDRPATLATAELAGQLGATGARSTVDWWGEVDGAGEEGTAPYAAEPPGPAVILFTSGSSGTPKAAVLTHENLLAYIMETVEFIGADEDEALLLAAPPFHIAGVAAVLSSVYSGRRLLTLPGFTPEGWLHLARIQGATHAFVVPTMLARIVQVMRDDPSLRVPTLRSISYGGARMALPVLEQALELFPEVGFVNAYGLTETSSTIAVLGPDDHREALAGDDPDMRRRLASVGRPLPGVEVAIVDESGTPSALGVRGAIRVRGSQVGGRYLDSRSGLDEDGWLVTGDVGCLDANGYLYVEGRADDVIIKGGENLSPSEIEDELLRHPAVTAAVVVGVPDDDWGETVAAAVVVRPLADGPASAETVELLMAFVRARLGSLKTPSRIDVVDELPSTDTGKVLRRVVRERMTGAGPDGG